MHQDERLSVKVFFMERGKKVSMGNVAFGMDHARELEGEIRASLIKDGKVPFDSSIEADKPKFMRHGIN